MESVSSLGTKYGTAFFIFEMLSVTIFGIEYILRIWCMAANEASSRSSHVPAAGRIHLQLHRTDRPIAILPSLLPLLLGEMDLRWLLGPAPGAPA